MRVRDANTSDIDELARVKEPAVLHEDRIRDAANGEFRYLVLEDDSGGVLGHACLVFTRPKAWPPDEADTPYPLVIDLVIRRQKRRHGFGKEFMTEMEAICRRMGFENLHLSVDPENNAGALKFHQTLGYTVASGEPQWRKWSFKDSEGNVHQGEGLDLRMSKEIAEQGAQGDA